MILSMCSIECFLKSAGFIGFLIGFGLAFILMIIARILFCSNLKTITFNDTEKGSFCISVDAIVSFVKTIVSRYEAFIVNGIKVKNTREGAILLVKLLARPNIDIATQETMLQNDIINQLSQQLGITEQIKKIDIQIVGFIQDEN